jgi:hypothetical protein
MEGPDDRVVVVNVGCVPPCGGLQPRGSTVVQELPALSCAGPGWAPSPDKSCWTHWYKPGRAMPLRVHEGSVDAERLRLGCNRDTGKMPQSLNLEACLTHAVGPKAPTAVDSTPEREQAHWQPHVTGAMSELAGQLGGTTAMAWTCRYSSAIRWPSALDCARSGAILLLQQRMEGLQRELDECRGVCAQQAEDIADMRTKHAKEVLRMQACGSAGKLCHKPWGVGWNACSTGWARPVPAYVHTLST